MALVLNGSTGITYPAGGTDNVAGAGVGTTDTQTLSNKTISGNLNMTGGSKYQVSGKTTNAVAWVQFAGASGTIYSAYNVSSVTRTATGAYTVSFTNAMPDTYYVVQANTPRFVDSGGTYSAGRSGYTASTASTLYLIAQYAGSGGYGYYDASIVDVVIFGN